MDRDIFNDRGAEMPMPKNDSADQLREQAAACRRLAASARTKAGSKALDGLGDHFDERARQIDPSSQKR